MAGWFSVKRGITQHHLFRGDAERLMVWLWLLDNAAWKDTRHDVQGATVTVPRGSVCVSLRHISGETGVGLQRVRTAIKRFTDENMIDTQLTHGKSLITLCNFEKYQTPNSPSNTAPTQDQHSANTQKKQGNNITKEDSAAALSRFQEFWDTYPHRNGKKDKRPSCEKAYAKAVLSGVDHQAIIAAASDYRSDPDVKRGFGRSAEAWLNQKGWADERIADSRAWRNKPESEWTKADRDAERMRWL